MNIILDSIYQTVLPLISDKQLVKWKFKWHLGYSINLNDPKTLNEKINWLKLNVRTALHTKCSDKFMVRQYVKETIGEKFLVPLYFNTKNPKEIISENIPDLPCIIKTNHDSGGGIIIIDKNKINWQDIQLSLKKRLNSNYYLRSREWQYKNIEPRIIVEKLLQDRNGRIPYDYKLHCFNGKVRMISVDTGRGTMDHHRNWYSSEWQREPYKWSSPKGPGKFTDPNEIDIEKPNTLEDMIRLSEVLAEPFSYVRVDWYDVDDIIYFGELTFHHDGGFRPIEPRIWDEILGSELKIDIK